MITVKANWFNLNYVRVDCPYAREEATSYGLKPVEGNDKLFTGKPKDVRRFVDDWRE